MTGARDVVRVAAIADVHCSHNCPPVLQPLLAQVAESADILALCGDLTDYGLVEEAHLLVKELSNFKLPVLAVLGNHDFEGGHQDDIRKILLDAGVHVLDGEATEIAGVGFAGIKGFGGGFGRGTLSAWGERAIKTFVQEAIDEGVKLEGALGRLHTLHRIVLMHYSPIRETVIGEPLEIFPYLGCSRFEEPLNRFEVNAVLHGHAHSGSPEGQTKTGIPVYNVSMPVMKRHFPDRPPFRVITLHIEPAPSRDTATPQSPPVETEVR